MIILILLIILFNLQILLTSINKFAIKKYYLGLKYNKFTSLSP